MIPRIENVTHETNCRMVNAIDNIVQEIVGCFPLQVAVVKNCDDDGGHISIIDGRHCYSIDLDVMESTYHALISSLEFDPAYPNVQLDTESATQFIKALKAVIRHRSRRSRR